MEDVLVSGLTYKPIMAKCIHDKHVTDLELASHRTNRGAKEYILCEVQQTITGIRLSVLHICQRNRHIHPYSSEVEDHRPLPWASLECPVVWREDSDVYIIWYIMRGMCLNQTVTRKKKKKTHLSHIFGQQCLQFLNNKQTQGTGWVELHLERAH